MTAIEEACDILTSLGSDPRELSEKFAAISDASSELAVLRKEAVDWNGVWDGLKGYASDAMAIPAVRNAAIGAGLGGVAGGIAAYNRPKEDRHLLSSAMTGALGGGILGGAGTFAYDSFIRARDAYRQADTDAAGQTAKLQPGLAYSASKGLLGAGAAGGEWTRSLPGRMRGVLEQRLERLGKADAAGKPVGGGKPVKDFADAVRDSYKTPLTGIQRVQDQLRNNQPVAAADLDASSQYIQDMADSAGEAAQTRPKSTSDMYRNALRELQPPEGLGLMNRLRMYGHMQSDRLADLKDWAVHKAVPAPMAAAAGTEAAATAAAEKQLFGLTPEVMRSVAGESRGTLAGRAAGLRAGAAGAAGYFAPDILKYFLSKSPAFNPAAQ